MEQPLSRDKVKQMMLMRYAKEEVDYEYISQCLDICYEYGYQAGLNHAILQAGRQFADILSGKEGV